MYEELYAIWQREIENSAPQPLQADFYARISEYLNRINQEVETADKKTLKGSLLEREKRNVTRIVKELLKIRYKKLVNALRNGQKAPINLLAYEEEEVFKSFLPFAEAYRAFAKSLLQGQTGKKVSADTTETPHKRVVLRFLKAVPAIIGSDMKTYGPFAVEDVASVPVENAKILAKQGFAEVVDVS